MSNKIVPTTYRAIIDDVISNIRREFDEFGVDEEVLQELLQKWETKVMNSHVAEFETSSGASTTSSATGVPPVTSATTATATTVTNPFTPAATNGAPLSQAYYANPYMALQAQQQGVQVKAEPRDPSYILQPTQYALPPLPAPSLGGPPASNGTTGPTRPMGTSVLSFPLAHSASVGSAAAPSSTSSTPRIPQIDGPPSTTFVDPTPPPRNSHPSLPQPSSATPAASVKADPDPEAINSDLDDSDTENEVEDGVGEGGGEEDIVYCTYDKVARVKNKWKTTLTQGMVHVNGRDYLFQKCTGEFEW